jgi:hypothetical protein
MKIKDGGNVWIRGWITYSSVSPDFFAGFLQINDERSMYEFESG